MNATPCPRCNLPVSEELPGGLCPMCLMAAARASAPAVTGSHPHSPKSAAPSIATISKLFPELEVLELIGQGGMGAVFKTRQKNLDRVVALKVFLAKPDDAEFAARFQREARVLAKLNHPNIVTVHDFGVRGNIHFLTMEFVDGMNLRQLGAAEKISPQMALQMVPQLCDALQYAHDRGVIHRDIKPENLLVSTTGGIKIADFGLAKMTGTEIPDSLTRSQQVMGTYNYMAPEQRERPTEVDHRADIYSLGVVIYEMLTGELPLGRFQPPSSKSNIDARLDEAVMRALEREPERRYQKVSDFKTGLGNSGNIPSDNRATRFDDEQSYAQFNMPRPPVKTASRRTEHPASGDKFLFTMLSTRERKGNWQPGDLQTVITILGQTVLDLTEVTATEVNLNVFSLLGGTTIIVPYGATVDLDGMIVMGVVREKVESTGEHYSPLHIRARAWGALGECEVRTPKTSWLKKAKERYVSEHSKASGTILGRGLVFMYRMIAMMISIAIPIVFLAAIFDLMPGDEGIMVGAILSIVAGMFWSGLKYFRVLVRGGAENDSEVKVREYASATIFGSLIRGFALLPAFTCPILLVVSVFEKSDREELRFVAIVMGIVAIAIFAIAKNIETYLYGKRI